MRVDQINCVRSSQAAHRSVLLYSDEYHILASLAGPVTFPATPATSIETPGRLRCQVLCRAFCRSGALGGSTDDDDPHQRGLLGTGRARYPRGQTCEHARSKRPHSAHHPAGNPRFGAGWPIRSCMHTILSFCNRPIAAMACKTMEGTTPELSSDAHGVDGMPRETPGCPDHEDVQHPLLSSTHRRRAAKRCSRCSTDRRCRTIPS